ncbi:carbohydrate ABC transporter permease [Paenibacillus agricola]|uniref:Sugar ABC transporter permease n=1 Tax=Paenibacillus agricola TaxID=2716264 RepID=A0ABX0JJT9_9BACL|nr:sugar ABC transporter permease [Paenibacillus agricola]NHN34110.1 sugar ABC transporter permease [Paenibacillus agricola]
MRLRESLQYTSLSLPAIILYLVLVIVPLIGAFYYSFTDWDGLGKTYRFIGLDNYFTLFTDKIVLRTFSTTMKYTICVTVFQNLLALLLAIALNQSIKTKNVLRTAIFIVCTLSPLLNGYIWSFVYSGPLMGVGRLLGIDMLANNILGSKDGAIYAAAFASIWRMTGWTMIIFLAGLQMIPKELYEAAEVDGVGPFYKFFYITLPLLAPAITINVVLTFERGLKDFDSIFALTGGGPGDSTLVMALSIYKESFFFSRAGYGTTIGIMLFLLIVVCTLIQLKFLRKREEDVI